MSANVFGDTHVTKDFANIQAGGVFETFLKFTLAEAAVKDYVFTTPAAGLLHYRPAAVVTTADSVVLSLHEGVTSTGGSAVATQMNHNRNSANAVPCDVIDGATVSATGTQIGQAFMGGSTGVGQSRSGATMGEANEWVLKPGTKYLLRVTNGSSASNTIQLNLLWYLT